MGQIVSAAAKPKRCNANKLSQLGIPAAGEYILVSSDNSMNAAGQGNFDCYIKGDGTKTATELELKRFKGEELDIQLNGIPNYDKTIHIDTTTGTAISWRVLYPVELIANREYIVSLDTNSVNVVSITCKDSAGNDVQIYVDGGSTLQNNVGFNIASGQTKRIIKPPVDVKNVYFYSAGSNVTGNNGLDCNLFWDSGQHGVLNNVLGVKSDVDRLDKQINGSDVYECEIVADYAEQYTFEKPIEKGSIITKIERSPYNQNIYPVNGLGLLDTSINYDSIANNLPYEVPFTFIGLKGSKNGYVTIYVGEEVTGLVDVVDDIQEQVNTQNASIQNVSNDVAEINEVIYGKAENKETLTTPDGNYATEVLFSSVLPAGTIIYNLEYTKNVNFYLTKENGSLDTSVMRDTIKNNLPYTLTSNYRGIKANGADTFIFTLQEKQAGIEENVEEILAAINEFRKQIFIYANDTEIEILNKFVQAFEHGDTDVIFERGTYTFSEAYIYMRDTLGWSWSMGLPIGNGCRYYFNGSKLISNAPSSTYSESRNILDCKVRSTDFELYDGILINNGGTYCVHDEGNSGTKQYFHKYVNIQMECSGVSCIGCGTGFDAVLDICNCTFKPTGGSESFQMHGPTNNPNNLPCNANIRITESYSKGKAILKINPAQYLQGTEFVLQISNCAYSAAPSSDTLSVPTELIMYNNTIISE